MSVSAMKRIKVKVKTQSSLLTWLNKEQSRFYEVWNEKTCEIETVEANGLNETFERWFRKTRPNADMARGEEALEDLPIAPKGSFVIPFKDFSANYVITPYDKNVVDLMKWEGVKDER